MSKRIALGKAGILLSASLLASGLMATESLLESSDKASNDIMGISVGVSGSVLVSGAAGDENFTGSAYIFNKSGATWSQTTKLTPPDGAEGDRFAWAVGIDGSNVVIGSPRNASYRGAIYISNYAGSWGTPVKYTAADGAANDQLGISVSISGDHILAGALGDAGSTGAAYIFTNSEGTWSETVKLTASDAATGDLFGTSVCIVGNYAIVGAPGDESSKGAVYVFKNNSGTWSQSAKLTASDGVAGDLFGTAISLSGDYLAIGAPGASSATGAAYVFKNTSDTWTQTTKLAASDGVSGDKFGSAVSMTGTVAVVSAVEAAGALGKIYAYKKGESSWAETLLSFTFTTTWRRGWSLVAVSDKVYAGAPNYSSSQGAVIAADYTLNDSVVFISFDDEVVGASDGDVTFMNPSTWESQEATLSSTSNVSCEYLTGYSDMALTYAATAATGTKINGINLDWGKKIVLEAKIYKGSEASAQIDLIKNTTASTRPLEWYIDSSGIMHLKLNGGSNCHVYTTSSVLADNTWTKLYAVIDLTQATIGNAFKLYSVPEGAPQSNYFGSGADGDCTISTNTDGGAAWDSGASGEMLVKNFHNFTVNSGVTLTIYARKGIMIYATGDVNIQGTVKVKAGYSCDPSAAGVSETGLKIIRKKVGSTDTLSTSDLAGCGSAATAAELNQPGISGDGKIYAIPRAGGAATLNRGASGAAVYNNGYAGTAGSTLQSGGGGSGSAGSPVTGAGSVAGGGAAGTCFSGGSGGGGANYGSVSSPATANGGAGTAGARQTSYYAGGGAGNPGGVADSCYYGTCTGSGGAAGSTGTGGLLILIAKGNFTTGASGAIECKGANGGGTTGNGCGGGASGGGVALILYGGTSSNSGTISCAGGSGGVGVNATGGAGGAGSYVIEQIDSDICPLSGSSVYNSGSFSGTNPLANADNSVEMLSRDAACTLKADFLKMRIKIPPTTTITVDDLYSFMDAEVDYRSSNSSTSIIITPQTLLRRVVNPPSDFTNGVKTTSGNVTYDTHPSPASVFYGMFEINVGLNPAQFSGTVTVDFYIQKPGEASFKKIGERTVSVSGSSTVPVTLYWNSRAAAYEWTASDAGPYKTDGPVRFKFSVR